jgi:ribosomal protein L16 Arg81 hydroxylase
VAVTSHPLGALIDPVGPAEFRATYWERQPLHVARPLPSWCGELPSIADLDAIISLTPPPGDTSNDVRLVRTTPAGSEDMPVARTMDGRPDMSGIYRAYASGWTVIVNALHLRDTRVARLALAIARELGHRVGVNLYFTPAGSQGFNAHVDGHDVFILQLDGHKSWRVFPAEYPLPLEDQDVPIDTSRLRTPLLEVTTGPGHVLYVPRGFIHDGAAQSEASMHLTIGIHVLRWIDVVEAALREAALHDVRLRRTAPPLDAGDRRAVDVIGRELAALLRRTPARKALPAALKRLRDAQDRRYQRSPDPQFRAIELARSLRGATEVMQRIGLRPRVVRGSERAQIEFGNRRVSAPLSVAPALDFVARTERFRVQDLPEPLTGRSKIVLARRLIQEGLLTIATSS